MKGFPPSVEAQSSRTRTWICAAVCLLLLLFGALGAALTVRRGRFLENHLLLQPPVFSVLVFPAS